MLTVSKLARLCGLSRTTVLYYESIGLLKPRRRGTGNYRLYGERERDRLRQIRAWRESGLKLDDIRGLLDSPSGDAAGILKRRLLELEEEIHSRRNHQKAILLLLREAPSMEKEKEMTKRKWTSIMRAAGFSDEDMRRWHKEFERSAPDDHRQFLEYLNIPQAEVAAIRASSGS